ncbi:hypothetical protein LL946_10795 [Knoellia locipacati]|uniref:hypothetical protein n=1 Tax=Knoellia locipacati TaxID=882824 RepID=UPI00384D1E41
MSQPDYSEWVGLLRQKSHVRSLLFLQLGAAHEPARRALREAGFALVSAADVANLSVDSPESLIVIDGVEQLVNGRSDLTLGLLRERAFAWVEAGRRCILLSRAPRAAFPAVPGSSLLDDASFAHGPDVQAQDVSEWPTCVIDGADPDEVLRGALSELGAEVNAAMDRAIFDCLLTGGDAIGILSARDIEAIEAAGLITAHGTTSTWNFPTHLVPLKEALADVLAEQVLPQEQLGDVSRGLWQLERLVRRAVRRRAIEAWGTTWRQHCLTKDQSAKVLERATQSAYPAANSIKLIRDPLEWLSLGELLDLKQKSQIGDLGIPDYLWRNFAGDIMPIRNRLAHMRTLHPGDSANVVKWLRVLEIKLAK